MKVMVTIQEAMKIVNKSKLFKESRLTCPLKFVDNTGVKLDRKGIKQYIDDMKNKYNVKITVTNEKSFGFPICNIRGNREDLEKYIKDELDPDVYNEQIIN